MSARDQAVALRWLINHIALLSCDECGGRWVVKKSEALLFHRCRARRSAGFDWRAPRERADDERRAWAERALGANPIQGALEDAIPEEHQLRRVE